MVGCNIPLTLELYILHHSTLSTFQYIFSGWETLDISWFEAQSNTIPRSPTSLINLHFNLYQPFRVFWNPILLIKIQSMFNMFPLPSSPFCLTSFIKNKSNWRFSHLWPHFSFFSLLLVDKICSFCNSIDNHLVIYTERRQFAGLKIRNNGKWKRTLNLWNINLSFFWKSSPEH